MNPLVRPPTRAGLCVACRHSRVVETRRGSTFVLCELSTTDHRFARYPPLPVLRCDGFEALDGHPLPDRPSG